MGISYSAAEFLACCSPFNPVIANVDFSRTITLGRLNNSLNESETRKILTKIGKNQGDILESILSNTYSEPYFELLRSSCTKSMSNTDNKATTSSFELGGIDSVDYTDYEGATVIHDLNIPLLNELRNRYTCVYDGGLLEHVYNFPTALKNAMDLVSIGGHLILSTPGNSYFGHGFYQFSPELFYSVLREENGFTDTKVFAHIRNSWYLLSNPRETRERCSLSPIFGKVLLHVIAKKVTEVPTNIVAYQSDYEDLWTSSENNASSADKRKSKNRRVKKAMAKKLSTFSECLLDSMCKCIPSYRRKSRKVFVKVRL